VEKLFYFQGYLNPMLCHRTDLSLTTLDVSSLFGCIEQVFAFNRHFYSRLDAANLNLLLMADAFVENEQGFEVYASYCTLYPK
jgi:hypothetical protein